MELNKACGRVTALRKQFTWKAVEVNFLYAPHLQRFKTIAFRPAAGLSLRLCLVSDDLARVKRCRTASATWVAAS
jgi:hypothetical protein